MQTKSNLTIHCCGFGLPSSQKSAAPADGKGERIREDITISQGQDMMRANCKILWPTTIWN
jgi:hypothetical protein